MNRRLDGEYLSVEDLEQIAMEHCGLSAEDISKLHAANHDANLYRSVLSDKTAQARFDLFMAGKLNLDTRTERNSR